MPDLLPRLKTTLAHTYHLERELGRGGMATVYLAEDWKHRNRHLDGRQYRSGFAMSKTVT